MEKNIINLEIKKASKKTNKSSKKTRPVKVVYISNPMKIKTSASKFRALVQELTGRDSDYSDPAKFSGPTDDEDSTAEIEARDLGNNNIDNDLNGGQLVMTSEQFEQSSGSTNSSSSTTTISASPKNNPYDMFNNDDVVFMMEGFSGISPSSVWYETFHQVV